MMFRPKILRDIKGGYATTGALKDLAETLGQIIARLSDEIESLTKKLAKERRKSSVLRGRLRDRR